MRLYLEVVNIPSWHPSTHLPGTNLHAYLKAWSRFEDHLTRSVVAPGVSPDWLSLFTQALLGDSSSQSWNAGVTDRYGRLDRELQLANSHFIEEQQAQQQVPDNNCSRPGASREGASPDSSASHSLLPNDKQLRVSCCLLGCQVCNDCIHHLKS